MAYKPTYDAIRGRVAALEKELKHTRKKLQHTQKRLALFQEDETLYRLVVDNARDAIFLNDVKTEQGFKKSEEAGKALLNATTESALLVDLEGTILAINQVGAERFGRSVDEMTGMIMGKYLPAELVKKRIELLKDIYRSGKPFRFQDEQKGRFFHNSLYPVYNRNQEIVAVAIFTQDITRQKLALEGLQESISHFTSLMENSDDYILISDSDGKPIVWNKAYAQIMKDMLDVDMEPGLLPHKLLPDKKAIAWWDNIHKKALLGEKFRVEYTRNSPNEGLRYLELSYNPIIVNGKVNGFSEITRDITELKQTLIKAAESEETARALLNAPMSYAALFDRNGIILDANKSMAQKFNKSLSDFIGVYAWNLFPLHIAENRKSKFENVIRSKQMIRFEDERQGTWFDNIFFPIFNAQQEVTKVGCLAYDITDRKKIENQLKTFINEKEVLLREIHHRVKNNMQIIISLLQLQASKSEDQEVFNLFQESQNRITSMALIHEKLYQTNDFFKLNINEYIRDIGEHLFTVFNIDFNRISFQTDISDVKLSLDQAIPCGIILNELISNSLKHAFSMGQKGRIIISLKIGKNNEIELIVSDNGIGLSMEMEYVKPKTLGLNLVKTLVEKQLKGKIDIDHEKGTQFRISFLNT